ncbi:hypothetical protein [Bradyrhizobium sp. McL0616]|uniref:hypothetical protein n=1 Tax=Bradyrhizobium sp. McL0616 TaxID=3415674 RepID=UPI003CED6285
MVKSVVSREAFRGLFALYAARAHHDQQHDGENRLLQLFVTTKDVPDYLLELWSDPTQLFGSETVGTVLGRQARQIADGSAHYDHASNFLHALLRDVGRNAH